MDAKEPGVETTTVLTLRGPLTPRMIPGLCDQLRADLASTDASVVICDVGDVGMGPGTLEVLARLQLTAQAAGSTLRLRNAYRRLQDLLTITGLTEVLREEG